jgi:VWFA-related protein
MARVLSCRRVARLFLVLLLSSASSRAIVGGDQPTFTFHANSNEVRLKFSVTDQSEHGVATLQRSDFVVVDRDMVVRNFESFARSDWTKLEIAILLDSSESVTPRFRQEIGDAISLLSQSWGIPDENLSIFSFRDSQPVLVCAGDCRASHAADRLPTAQAGGLTPLFDAIIVAADSLAQRGDSHVEKVLVIFSDGADTVSRNTLSDAVEAAVKDEIEVYGVDLNHSATQEAAVLYHLSAATGGHYLSAQAGPTVVLNAILEDFRASYTVSYHLPSHVLGFHNVRILPTHNLNLHFRSRSGYYYPNNIR